MADQDESVDSRTSTIRRKRQLGNSVEPGEVSENGTSAEESYETSRKRLKQREEHRGAAGSPSDDVRCKTVSAQEMDVTDPPSTQRFPQRVPSELPSTSWNKGVKTDGIRTSFEKKLRSTNGLFPNALESWKSLPEQRDAEMNAATILSDTGSSVPSRMEASPPIALWPILQSRAGNSRASVSSKVESILPTAPRELGEDAAMTGDRTEAFNSDYLYSQPTTDGRPEPTVFEVRTSTGEPSSKPQPPILRDASNSHGGWDAPKIPPEGPRAMRQAAKNSSNVIQSKDMNVGSTTQVPTAPEQKLTKAQMKAQRKEAAALGSLGINAMIEAIKAVAAAQGMASDDVKRITPLTHERGFTKKQLAAYRTLSDEQKATLPREHVKTFEHGIQRAKEKRDERKKAKGGTRRTDISSEAIVLRPTNTSTPIITDDTHSDDLLEVTNSHSDSADPEDEVGNGIDTLAASSIADILLSLSERDLELQLKYFPTDDGRVYIPHCLSCTQVGHGDVDCPMVSCAACGDASNHSTSSCPKKQRCGRCREIGHSTSLCPAKLARLRSEDVPCDLCGSMAHIENECHMMWRSFFPRLEEIKTVRSLPMDCYTCGNDTHLGPECGLYQGPGNITWSRANFMRYVSDSGMDNAISAGVDYTIKSRPKKNLNIRGKANHPKPLDDSDDDVQEFIRTKVNTSAPKGSINFGSLQPPSGPRGNQAKETRPAFGTDPYAPVQPARKQGPAMYERERSFSPPQRFDENRSQYPPFRDGQQPSTSFQDFSRPLPESQHRIPTTKSIKRDDSTHLPRPSNPAGGGPGKGRGRKKPKTKTGRGGAL